MVNKSNQNKLTSDKITNQKKHCKLESKLWQTSLTIDFLFRIFYDAHNDVEIATLLME